MITRRAFLQLAAAFGVTAVLPPGWVPGAALEPVDVDKPVDAGFYLDGKYLGSLVSLELTADREYCKTLRGDFVPVSVKQEKLLVELEGFPNAAPLAMERGEKLPWSVVFPKEQNVTLSGTGYVGEVNWLFGTGNRYSVLIHSKSKEWRMG